MHSALIIDLDYCVDNVNQVEVFLMAVLIAYHIQDALTYGLWPCQCYF